VAIKTFADKDTERIFERQRVRAFGPELSRVALRKLLLLHAATSLQDLRVPPGNRLEALSGDRAGAYSIRINDQYRVCFRWDGHHAHDVEIVDYH
jgi:proteic killer suppression protein